MTGKRRTVYAPTLEDLRAKEDEINKAQDSGVDYNAGNVTVIELLERYISLKQGVRKPDCTYYAEKTKTESGCRFIPMTDNAHKALKNIVARRKTVSKEWIIDGYSGFLLLDKNGNPKVAMHIEHHFQWALKKYRKLHPDKPLPKITPHVFRHTFCTKMANAGMDLKSLQYLMGHSDAGVTMNVYTHTSYDHAEQSMQKILQFQLPEKALKSG